MKKGLWAVIVGLAVVVAAAGAAAQQTPGQPSSSPGTSPGQGPLIDASSIIGSTVRSQDGKDVGKVDRLMVDPRDGRVHTIVIAMGGTLGFGSKTVSMPWDQVKLARDAKDATTIVVTVQQQLLDQAPQSEAQRQRSEKDQDRAPSASPSTQGQSQPQR